MFKRKLSALDYGKDYNPQGKEFISISMIDIFFQMKINFVKWLFG
jgi:hypothetical protein